MSAVHPANSLPSELLSRIFELYGAQPPVSLALVSRQWASITFTTPSLWTDLRIVVPATPRGILAPESVEEREFNDNALMSWATQVKEYSLILHTWLERSRDMPLNIEICMGRSLSEAGGELLSVTQAMNGLIPIFSCLAEVSDRVKTLAGAAKYPSPLFYSLMKKNFLLALRQITLDIEVQQSGHEEAANGNIDNTAVSGIDSLAGSPLDSPSLEVIDVQTMPLIMDLEANLPSWSNLTQLGTLIVIQSQLRNILSSCRSLVEGSFQLHDISPPLNTWVGYGTPPVSLPELRVLSLINFDTGTLNCVFSAFKDMPLENLFIKNRRCTHTEQWNCSAKMYDLIPDCGSTLRELMLDHICLDHQRLQVYLETLPVLTSLMLEYGPDTDDVGTVLRQHRLPTDLCFNEILAQLTPSLLDSTESSYEDDESAVTTLAPELTTLVLNVPDDRVYINQGLAENFRISRTSPHAEVNKVAPLEVFTIDEWVLVPESST
ncbi:hypothetical protein MD484_g7917, partial [Candolleomyces efflorescens]